MSNQILFKHHTLNSVERQISSVCVKVSKENFRESAKSDSVISDSQNAYVGLKYNCGGKYANNYENNIIYYIDTKKLKATLI